MRDVLFIQGGGKGTHDTWDNKLVASLAAELGPEYTIHYPQMPNEAEPDPTAWKKSIADELRRLSAGAFLVGHSVGAAIGIDYLASVPRERRPAAVFLIATPFIGDGGWPNTGLRPTRTIDLHDGPPLYFYQGRRDETVPLSHVELFASVFPRAIIRRLDARDHQLDNDLSEIARDIEIVSGTIG